MALDFSKLNTAVSKVADLAKSHAAAHAARDTAVADLANAQAYIDSLATQLIAAAQTPAEAAGIAAVASALTVAPVAVTAVDAGTGAAPAIRATTFLPGDPRAPKA
ncbi:hypothetical protein [Tardiphaga sp. 367_B4_N1_1]|uniref:hypothetical protein n=1 Tax=Tardiphaga sp. 367_B4_N1_1 TaxID=3240777 RepID=UPI003F258014